MELTAQSVPVPILAPKVNLKNFNMQTNVPPVMHPLVGGPLPMTAVRKDSIPESPVVKGPEAFSGAANDITEGPEAFMVPVGGNSQGFIESLASPNTYDDLVTTFANDVAVDPLSLDEFIEL